MTVKSIASHNAGEIVAMVDVAADAVPGKRDVVLATPFSKAPWRYTIRWITSRCCPKHRWRAWAAMSNRRTPEATQQFEAVAYQRGEDGKLHTADDVELGPVDVTGRWRNSTRCSATTTRNSSAL